MIAFTRENLTKVDTSRYCQHQPLLPIFCMYFVCTEFKLILKLLCTCFVPVWNLFCTFLVPVLYLLCTYFLPSIKKRERLNNEHVQNKYKISTKHVQGIYKVEICSFSQRDTRFFIHWPIPTCAMLSRLNLFSKIKDILPQNYYN